MSHPSEGMGYSHRFLFSILKGLCFISVFVTAYRHMEMYEYNFKFKLERIEYAYLSPT